VKIAIGSDHGGYELKEYLKKEVLGDHEVMDEGAHGLDSVDYPDYAEKVARLVTGGRAESGILICSTGVGMSVAANKVAGIRAALAFDLYTASQSRRHVDANVLVLGAMVTGKGLAAEIVRTWLGTAFEGGRHEKRIAKIRRLEQ
jgi:ribose 5-phosphate isomerase B